MVGLFSHSPPAAAGGSLTTAVVVVVAVWGVVVALRPRPAHWGLTVAVAWRGAVAVVDWITVVAADFAAADFAAAVAISD